MEIETPSILLKVFEELGNFTDNGLVNIKPFQDWKGFKWQNKVFTLRLCNAGETLDILSFVDKVPETARGQAIKQEIAIRSINSIDERPLVTEEELKKYNDGNNTKLSELQYLRTWVGNIEQVILDRLDVVYSSLQLKQIRSLQDNYQCERCGTVYEKSKLSKNSHIIKYSLGEIICETCMAYIEEGEYDFTEVHLNPQTKPVTPTSTEGTEDPLKDSKAPLEETDYICVCGQRFPIYEAFIEHKSVCDVVNNEYNSILNTGSIS